VSDRRYSTSAWQRLRRQILIRDGGICQIQGPRCRGVANTVHHIYPSSSHPHLFWAVENLASACSSCNYGGGAQIAADNRRAGREQLRSSREQITYLERVVAVQQERLEELADEIARLRNGPKPGNGRNPVKPAIY
jgi:5-methylcytosine-specific restriction endonuclease McrA